MFGFSMVRVPRNSGAADTSSGASAPPTVCVSRSRPSRPAPLYRWPLITSRSEHQMTLRTAAALVFAVASGGVVAFQIALAAGAPWGAYAMGGAFPGTLPLPLRIAALFQAVLIGGMVAVVLSRAGLVLAGWSRASRFAWLVVAFAAISLVLNLITPSAAERAIWAPVALLLLVSSTVVALTGRGATRPVSGDAQ